MERSTTERLLGKTSESPNGQPETLPTMYIYIYCIHMVMKLRIYTYGHEYLYTYGHNMYTFIWGSFFRKGLLINP